MYRNTNVHFHESANPFVIMRERSIVESETIYHRVLDTSTQVPKG